MWGECGVDKKKLDFHLNNLSLETIWNGKFVAENKFTHETGEKIRFSSTFKIFLRNNISFTPRINHPSDTNIFCETHITLIMK